MLQWTEEFETGYARIDLQHQMLIRYINELEGVARNTNPSRKEVEFILHLVDFVERYTIVHFELEERCMHRHSCPAYNENKDAHQTFLQFFRQFKTRLATDGCRPDVVKELHNTCSSWISRHILKIDTQLRSTAPDPESPAEFE